jgi:hypothetical protein
VKPLPWSPSALSTFVNCPGQYHATYVAKSVRRVSTSETEYGNFVHKCFEDFLNGDKPLPVELIGHQDYLTKIDRKPGFFFAELKAAFNKQVQPCSWDWRPDEIWARFKIDYLKVDKSREVPIAWVYDFKTGKQKDDFKQLAIYALYVFAAFPVDIVDVRYYWTQTKTDTRKVWSRSEIDSLWDMIKPDLIAYREAFKTDTWQLRQSGLCHGWCPVETCQFWQPKRERRRS